MIKDINHILDQQNYLMTLKCMYQISIRDNSKTINRLDRAIRKKSL
ncbi:unnamed protein product [Paramecium pentaurelia]|uniref:Uncharacterized protein n=1 Tax=Paramecium pentaurelia TaxID=43138 RepID=A0A8S1W1A6_9CILI|nr:unnamed protein product [Paramecium pentaurelia]